MARLFELPPESLKKWTVFCSWARWYPDLFLDLIKPEKGGVTLHFDQRVYLRCIVRFNSTCGVLPRGWSKTFCEVLAGMLCCIFYPGLTDAISAQTQDNAAELLRDKYNEIIKFWPMLEQEVEKATFGAHDAAINFKNGSRLDILANNQNSKGQRRHRLSIEESALMNNDTFQDVMEPIPNIGRPTRGKSAIVSPYEPNHQINFFTTAGFRGTTEYERNIRTVQDMVELKGKMVLGAGWELGCWYGRGLAKSAILQRKINASSVFFAQNYSSEWVGAADNALININKLLRCRDLERPMFDNEDDEEIYLGVDVARSESTANNQSSVAVIRVRRNAQGRVKSLDLVNVINISNTKSYTLQAIEVKRLKYKYNALMVVVDGNGLGAGLVDELLKEQYDPVTDEIYPCWNTVNTDNKPEKPEEAERCLFDLKAQGLQTKVITDFIDAVDSGKLRILVKKNESDFTRAERDDLTKNMLPYIQTDFLFAEVANLKLKTLANGNLTVEKSVRKMNKDRWSALAYVIFYIMEYQNTIEYNEVSDMDILTNFTCV